MYIGIQNNKVKFYTECKLDKAIYNLDEVIETEEKYVPVGDEYVLITDDRALEKIKEDKIEENDTKRDIALIQGVLYKGVKFDSDTDQKINLLAIISTMQEADTTVWYGMDNIPLECDISDLINIGALITELHTFCWTKNAEIKEKINEAKTIEEVESIEIDYDFEENSAKEDIEEPAYEGNTEEKQEESKTAEDNENA